MNIREWYNAGKPLTKGLYKGNVRTSPPMGAMPFYCDCQPAIEQSYTQAKRDEFYQYCPECRKQAAVVEGLAYSPSASAFVSPSAVAQPDLQDAAIIVPVIPPPEAVPVQTSVTNQVEAMASLGTIGGTAIGSLLAGPVGGTVGGTIGSSIASLGGSVCPGPYNYNASTGMCIPKEDCKQRQPSDPCVAYPAGGSNVIGISGPGATGLTDPGYTGGSTGPCPTGYTWDGTQCIATGITGTVQRILPGGQTGTGVDVYGQAVMGSFGRPALQPYVAQQVVRRCPRGTVLGKDGLCYDKIANGDRMWPRGPRPMMTGGEMKTLRKADALKKKVKRLATSSGFTCRKR